MNGFDTNQSVTRHINFLINECNNALAKGVLDSELESHPWELRSYNRKEDISKSIHSNLEKFIAYLKENQIAEYRTANDEDGYPNTVDIRLEDGEVFEIPAMYSVRVFDFNRLKKLGTIEPADENRRYTFNHLDGRIIHVVNEVAYYGTVGKKISYSIKFKQNTKARYLLEAFLYIAQSEPCDLNYKDIWNASRLRKKEGEYNKHKHQTTVFNAFREIIKKINELSDLEDANWNIPTGSCVSIKQTIKKELVEFSNPKVHMV